ncbi:MAG: fructosamine kinase family protein, partial [Spirochaetaceae bacterium]|nr:fructosamine kinase family protein [Spirochaetaceae bacterium]
MSIREFVSVKDALESLSPGNSLLSQNHSGSGGCINSTYLLKLKNGQSYFIKKNHNAPSDMFREEARGLSALAEKFPLGVPRPLAIGREGTADFLIMDYIKSSSQNKTFWFDFASALAEMHRSGGSGNYGFSSHNYIGSTRQVNDPMDCWTDFFCEKRLLFQLELAASRR